VPQTDPLGGAVILFALLMPVAMMALLFGVTALEERLFPQPSVTEDAGPPAASSGLSGKAPGACRVSQRLVTSLGRHDVATLHAYSLGRYIKDGTVTDIDNGE
jgi:hypothetical protein